MKIQIRTKDDKLARELRRNLFAPINVLGTTYYGQIYVGYRGKYFLLTRGITI